MSEPLNWDNVLQVRILEAKPNKMFSEAQTASVRFLHFSRAVRCAECGRRNRHQWTSLLSFQALSLGTLVPSDSGKVHPPMTPVCGTHLLAVAEMPEVKPKRERKPRGKA